MDAKFHPAMAAVKAGDLETFRTLLREDPSLATACSSKSHPNLLQCVVLDGFGVPNSIEMAKLLIDAGAAVDGPLIAASSMGNQEVIPVLLNAGAAINGSGGWSPIEDAMAFGQDRIIRFLLDQGATVHNLRIAAGVGRADLIDGFFNPDGSLKPEAGRLASPFDFEGKNLSQDPQDIIDNAFVYACRSRSIDTVERLLQHGARINAIPPGFDYAATGLHYAAMDGDRPMVEYLLAHGADPRLQDKKVGSTPAGWADHGGHPEIKELLERAEKGENMRAVYKRAAPYCDDALNLPVEDVEAAIPFYETVMGFQVVSRKDTPHRLAILGRDAVQIGLAENGGDPGQEGCFFEVDNVETAFAELRARGLDSENPNFRVDKHGNTSYRVFFVVAPDGLCYCIGERLS